MSKRTNVRHYHAVRCKPGKRRGSQRWEVYSVRKNAVVSSGHTSKREAEMVAQGLDSIVVLKLLLATVKD